LERSDVLIEGFRPGVMKRLGLDYDSLREKFPRLIYCAITGYGQDGPYSAMPGHDINYIGLGGVLRLNARGSDPPVIPPIQMADEAAGGMCAAVAILAALYDRQRTGQGRYIDISMADGIVSMLPFPITIWNDTGKNPEPSKEHLTGRYACYQLYEARDGRYLSIGAPEHRFWKNLCEALGFPEHIDQQFSEGEVQELILESFRKRFLERTRNEWFGFLKDRDVCVGRVLELDEVIRDPQVVHRRMIFQLPLPEGGNRTFLGNPIKMNDYSMEVRLPPARWGEHTVEILGELGYDPREIQSLREQGGI
jgi:crotonobetainyl-CoA:carnitine CoA-transferase CaiB-like acyl-CoA transferase